MITEEPQNEHETLNADEQKVREMCLSLKRVDAPKDFDFKLKARIASTKSSDFQPRFSFGFRYALPALALIFVLGFLAYNGGFLSSENGQVVAENSVVPQNPALPKNTLISTVSPPENSEPLNTSPVISTPSPEILKAIEKPQVAENNPSKPKKDLREIKKDSFISSKDIALTEADQPNFNRSPIIPRNLQNNENFPPMPVKEVLFINGIKADFTNGKWTVTSITANSIGEISGVKVNDVIEAIDNQSISVETVFKGTVNGTTLTITRNGEKSQIKLRNK